MPQKTEYWKEVAAELENITQKGKVEDWEEKDIKNFLNLLEKRVLELCRADNQKAALCKIPYIKGKYLYGQWETIKPSTFRRIFQYGTSIGQVQTKQQFAIFLGYDSYEDYHNKDGVDWGELEKNRSLYPDNKETFERMALQSSFRWLIIWLVFSTLVHNILGLVKGNLNFLPWRYLFWIPPIVLGVITYVVSMWKIGRSPKQRLLFLMIIWWLTLILMVFLNQYIPGWIHFIEMASLLMIGAIGQLSFSTKLFYIAQPEYATMNREKHFVKIYDYNINLVVIGYFIGLLWGLFLIAIMWIVPDENIRPYSNDLLRFRLYCAIEMIFAFILISIGFRRLIFRPLLHQNDKL